MNFLTFLLAGCSENEIKEENHDGENYLDISSYKETCIPPQEEISPFNSSGSYEADSLSIIEAYQDLFTSTLKTTFSTTYASFWEEDFTVLSLAYDNSSEDSSFEGGQVAFSAGDVRTEVYPEYENSVIDYSQTDHNFVDNYVYPSTLPTLACRAYNLNWGINDLGITQSVGLYYYVGLGITTGEDPQGLYLAIEYDVYDSGATDMYIQYKTPTENSTVVFDETTSLLTTAMSNQDIVENNIVTLADELATGDSEEHDVEDTHFYMRHGLAYCYGTSCE